MSDPLPFARNGEPTVEELEQLVDLHEAEMDESPRRRAGLWEAAARFARKLEEMLP